MKASGELRASSYASGLLQWSLCLFASLVTAVSLFSSFSGSLSLSLSLSSSSNSSSLPLLHALLSPQSSVTCCLQAALLVYLLCLLRQNLWRPYEPPVMFSWLPFLGSGLAIGTDALACFESAARLGEVVKCTIVGDATYLVTNPRLYPVIYKRPKDFSFAEAAEDVVAKAFKIPTDGLRDFDHHGAPKVTHRFLRSKEALTDLTYAAREALNSAIPKFVHELAEPSAGSATKEASANEWRHCSDLYEFVTQIMFRTTMHAVFGKCVADADLLKDFMEFDHRFPECAGGIPLKFFKTANAAKERLNDHFAGDYWTEMSEFIKARHDILSSLSTVSPKTEALIQVAVVWAAVANTMPTAFWTLYFVLRSEGVLPQLRREMAEAAQQVDPDKDLCGYLAQMPFLDSCMDEALRISTGSMGLRMVMRNSVLKTESGQEFQLRAGAKLMMCPSQLHFSEAVYPNPEVYQPDRFLKKKLTDTGGEPKEGQPVKYDRGPEFHLRGKPLRQFLVPFGGGVSRCPGNLFARNDVKVMVAVILGTCDMRLVGASEGPTGVSASDFPGFKPGRAGLGIYPPAKNVAFEIRQRM